MNDIDKGAYLSVFPFGSPTYDESVRLRYVVLREPLGLDYTIEQLIEEWDQIHVGIFRSNDALAGCLILKETNPSNIKMRQLAIDPSYQRMGLGAQLVEFSERLAEARDYKELSLHARQEAVPFYLKLGYKITSEPFEEVGIPHLGMIKILGQVS